MESVREITAFEDESCFDRNHRSLVTQCLFFFFHQAILMSIMRALMEVPLLGKCSFAADSDHS